jgi:hypothetical protein
MAFVALAAAKKKEEAPPPDPNAVVAKAHGGKVSVTDEALPSSEGDRLSAWLGARPKVPEVGRKTKDGPWNVSYVAVFKKPSAKGPITVQFFEKDDQKSVVDTYSPPNDVAALVFQSTYELEPDKGFNKGRTYVIKVGQILKGKFQSYASGELSLK